MCFYLIHLNKTATASHDVEAPIVTHKISNNPTKYKICKSKNQGYRIKIWMVKAETLTLYTISKSIELSKSIGLALVYRVTKTCLCSNNHQSYHKEKTNRLSTMRNLLNISLLLAALFTALILSATSAWGQEATRTTYFPYPTAPDTMQNLYDRTDFIITHFWERCDMKKAFSAKQRMSESLKDFLELMPYATRRAAHKSVASLIKLLDKQPKDLVFMADEAQKYLYSDSALYLSEELTLPFLRAVADHKKVDKKTRADYQKRAQIMMRSMIGAPTPYIEATDRSGTTINLSEIPDSASLTLIIIDTPDCLDCRLTRTRLNANINLTRLIDNGVLKIVSLTPSQADDEWTAAAAGYPAGWTVVASPDVTDFIDIRSNPYYILIDNNGLIRIKSSDVQEILNRLGA